MKLRVAARSDPGLVRAENEDAYIASLPLIVVADGVGGQNAGEVASALAVEVLSEWKPRLSARRPGRLREAARDANRRIYTRAQHDRALQGMATTLTAAWIEGGTCTLAQIGDSRAYLFRAGELSQLTEDQSAVAQLVKTGRISPEEAYTHPWRNRILQALGGAPDVVVDMYSIDLQVGDRLLLASDGLTDELRDDVLRNVLATIEDPEEAGRMLIARAKEAGGRDNITVVLADVTGNGDDDRPSRSGRIWAALNRPVHLRRRPGTP
jgi:PPM family protein phosphatase